ncbi:CPBP family intramembrane glutamic endopeptidase [Glycomyces sp. NPDC021274]|jgi:uncharacterized protein|uniref:CPBP family intramembrane glutamic endopeptidase n=1 Tax=Glycomyces sp. NPDC021274 TaxID=3155120 RepID=UPI0033D00B28
MDINHGHGHDRTAGWVLAGLAAFMTAFLLWWLVRDPQEFVEVRLGVTPALADIPWVWAVAAAIAIAYAGYTVWNVPAVREHVTTFSRLKLLGIWAAIVSGMLEEMVFRQLFMDWLDRSDTAAVTQIALSAIAFGIAHAAWIVLARDWSIGIPVIIATTILGAMLATLYLLADRSTLPAIATHTAINLVIEPWLIVGAIAGTWRAQAAPADRRPSTAHD